LFSRRFRCKRIGGILCGALFGVKAARHRRLEWRQDWLYHAPVLRQGVSGMIVKGQLTKIGDGIRKAGITWKAQTNLPEIVVGGRRIEKVVLPDDLKNHFNIGDTVELLILKFNLFENTICGIRVNGQTYKCGAINQLVAGLFFSVLFGWLIVTLIPAIISFKNYLEIDAF
jgi:hypothetical protein